MEFSIEKFGEEMLKCVETLPASQVLYKYMQLYYIEVKLQYMKLYGVMNRHICMWVSCTAICIDTWDK